VTAGEKTAAAEIPTGLRAAYISVLWLPAAVAPVPLLFTEGAAPGAVALYWGALALLQWSASRGKPIRLSDLLLNVIGLSYLVFLAFEISRLHHGLLRSVSHLLLFTAGAKLASMKRPGEARTALLVLFLLSLASASSSTHVSSLVYFAVMGWLGFRTLAKLAVLADFEDAPPSRVLSSVPTGGLATAVILTAALLSVPFFYALPRLRSPFATVPLRLDEALSSALTADRVELENFGAAKRSDRVVLTMQVDPVRLLPQALRLREAVFTDYRAGCWTRSAERQEASRLSPRRATAAPPPAKAQPESSGIVSINLNLFTNGFLFLPYGASNLEIERGYPLRLPDGVVQVAASHRAVRYSARLHSGSVRGPGSTVIEPIRVPQEVRDYAMRLTGDLDSPSAIYARIEENFRKGFVYTIDPPRAEGDSVSYFLLHSKAGHCEYFASAAALMLTARGIPARLVTGSYGGERGFFSRSLVVRGSNLHAWVEADLDGTGFVILDPTPPAGIPPDVQRVSWLSRLTGLGRELEFFYDRRVLGFDSIDQVQALEVARQGLDRASSALGSWNEDWRSLAASAGRWILALAGLAALWFLFDAERRRRARVPAATRAYLAIRRLLERRLGFLSPAVPPAEVARLLGDAVPQGGEDASAVVTVYCASAFGGIAPDGKTLEDLADRVRRLKKLTG
jgi:transglutaminase-like putative cysteine protease